MSLQDSEATIKPSMLIVMTSCCVLLYRQHFDLTELKELNPRCAARNARQAKIISRAKTARLVLLGSTLTDVNACA